MEISKIKHRKVIETTLKVYYKKFIYSESSLIKINCKLVSANLGIDERIYRHLIEYHYNKKFGMKNNEGKTIDIFTLKKEYMYVNYPLLVSINADLQLENNKFLLPIWISSAALVVAAIGVWVKFTT
ncbi:hypothetical protein [Colwellia psychrerythraea]|uniref:Uncharacterized protein n=1 Tax=Colwellia psychrerythraea TaxID=28229 RepID=A0A099KUD7_COLPS|nr:hypothetical protein [Colwellia psychrerythraea]KGJ93810.1 hypothetical protein GAB14E_2365 [Colwellia psychrerythraea]